MFEPAGERVNPSDTAPGRPDDAGSNPGGNGNGDDGDLDQLRSTASRRASR